MGIQNHSGATSAETYIIFSTDHPERFMILPLALNSGVKKLQGAYKSKTERAYICNAKHWHVLVESGVLAGQESVLVLGPWEGNCTGARPAALHFLGGGTLPINLGYFRETPKAQALASDAWTKDGDKYFICQHNA